MIRALLFDLGNVLLFFSHDRMCEQIGRVTGLPAQEVRQRLFEDGLIREYELGRVSTQEGLGHLSRRLGNCDLEELHRAACDIFWLNESIVPVIERLSSDGWPLVMVSNVNEAHMRWIDERFPVVRHFKLRALSFEVGSRKPDAGIYMAAAKLAGAEPAECFFTDDIAEHIEAARRLGFDAWQFKDTAGLVEQLRLRGIEV